MLTFKEFIIQEGKLSKTLTIAGGVGGALISRIPGSEMPPDSGAVAAITGATLGNIVGNRIEKLFQPKDKHFKVKIANTKVKPHIPDPKSIEYLEKRTPTPHQADPKPIRRQ